MKTMHLSAAHTVGLNEEMLYDQAFRAVQTVFMPRLVEAAETVGGAENILWVAVSATSSPAKGEDGGSRKKPRKQRNRTRQRNERNKAARANKDESAPEAIPAKRGAAATKVHVAAAPA